MYPSGPLAPKPEEQALDSPDPLPPKLDLSKIIADREKSYAGQPIYRVSSQESLKNSPEKRNSIQPETKEALKFNSSILKTEIDITVEKIDQPTRMMPKPINVSPVKVKKTPILSPKKEITKVKKSPRKVRISRELRTGSTLMTPAS